MRHGRGTLTRIALYGALLATAPGAEGQAREAEGETREEDVRYPSGDVTLAALLLSPPGPGPHPAAVIIQGSGDSDRTNRWSRDIADLLVGHGLAVLLTDKRGAGASGGDWRTAGFDELADDALAGVAFLRSRPDIDRERVGLVGLSQGGWIAPIAAARADVAFVVDVSGASVGFAEQSFHEMANTTRQAGFGEDAVAGVLELNRAAGHYLISNDWEAYSEARRRGMETPWGEIAAGFPGERDATIWTFLRKVFRYDPMPYWLQVSEPVFVVYGTEDERDNVPVAESVRRLEFVFRSVGKTDYEILVVPGVGHGIRLEEHPHPLAPAFVDALRRWLERHALAGETATDGVGLGATGRTADAGRAIRRGRRLVQTLMELSAIPALSVTVSVDGDVVWSEAFGVVDLEHPADATTSTLFRLASTSKILTASGAARLAQEGHLDLDAAIRRYLPELPPWADSITPRLLAGHLGGIRGYTSEDQRPCCDIDRRYYATTADALAIFVDEPLVADPGTEYRYSTFGYTLMSAVMEAACGEPFLACLDRTLLAPLGLARTTADDRARVIPGRTEFFERDAYGEIRHAEYVDPSYKWAGGGLLSTAEDLVKFGVAHLDPGFLEDRTLETLFTSQTTREGDPTGVGLGWRVGLDADGHRLAWHAGNMSGARSILLIDRDRRGVVAVLSNTSLGPYLVESTAQALLGPFLESASADRPGPAGGGGAVRGTWAYRFEGEDGRDDDQGILSIDPDGPPFGTMTLPASIAAIERLGVPAPECVPVVDVDVGPDHTTAVVVTSAGALTLRLAPTGDGFEGASAGLFAERSITGTVSRAPACSL